MKQGLILEGGAMRGMFTAGVLDVLMENNIDFAGAVGVSAGATFGCNFKSRQIGRAIRYNKRFCRDPRYCGIRSLITTGDLYGAKFCYETLPKELDVFDTETYSKNPMDFYVVCTDMNTGKAVYHNCRTGDGKDLKWMRASASLPGVSRPVVINGRKLSDGGTADSVPLKFMEKMGFEKNVVVLTQPAAYRKQTLKNFWLIKLMIHRYPALIKALETRPYRYNKNIAYIREREQAGEAFIICPEESLDIGAMEKDPSELERVYQTGRKRAETLLPKLKEYIKEAASLN
ncbi:MAG: patatin family protein [Lachnospiraceae bacterium]|nr:patatin family protein [Lachnospiraceae bacterium]